MRSILQGIANLVWAYAYADALVTPEVQRLFDAVAAQASGSTMSHPTCWMSQLTICSVTGRIVTNEQSRTLLSLARVVLVVQPRGTVAC